MLQIARSTCRGGSLFNFEDRVGRLFGCIEDIMCQSNLDVHMEDWEIAPFCRKLCPLCEIHVCRDCSGKLRDHNAGSPAFDGGTIPMSISNDHYYGHVSRYIVENNVTWRWSAQRVVLCGVLC